MPLHSPVITGVLFKTGWSGQSLSFNSHFGPSYQFPLSILSKEAPLVHKSAIFISEGEYFQLIWCYSLIFAIFDTLFDTNVFHCSPGLTIQYKADVLSIYKVIETTGSPFNAWHTLPIMFADIWPPISSSLGIEVFRLAILHFEVKSPITLSVSWSFTAMLTIEQAISLASENWWICTAFTFLQSLIKLLGTLIFRNWRVHFSQSLVIAGETSLFHSWVSSHASLYICFASTRVDDMIPKGSYILPRWLKIPFFVTGWS